MPGSVHDQHAEPHDSGCSSLHGGDIDDEDAGQHQQAVFDPLSSMLETAAAVAVLAAQKGAVHAA